MADTSDATHSLVADREEPIGSAELARKLGVNPESVRRWTVEGKIPVAFVLPGGRRRYLESQVLEALQ